MKSISAEALDSDSHVQETKSTLNTTKAMSALVGIIMGSKSDLNVMNEAADVLRLLQVPYEITVVSAHRTPERMFEYAKNAAPRGLKVIIAGAGGAAHLPGMTASLTPLPVIGVPIKSSNSIDGWDSVLSILQMPAGVPVATVALDGARNAGILAAQIVAAADAALLQRIAQFKEELKKKVMESLPEVEMKGTL
jgi:5-(carboxyamino)imidazole ribonucleotide mutase